MKVLNGFGKKIRQAGLGAILVGIMSVALVACGGDTATSAPAATEPTATTSSGSTGSASGGTGSGSGASIASAATLTEWSIALKQADVSTGKVKFTVANDGKFSHNFVVLEGTNEVARTANFTKDEGPQVLEVDLKPGSYKVLCDIPGHTEKGMVSVLTVK